MDVSKVVDSILKEASIVSEAFKEVDRAKKQLDNQTKLLKAKLLQVDKVLSKYSIKISKTELDQFGSWLDPILRLEVSFPSFQDLMANEPKKAEEVAKKLRSIVGNSNFSLTNVYIKVH